MRVRAIDAAVADARLIDALEIAGPGFINIRLSRGARLAVVPAVFREREAFGRNDAGAGRPVLVEFVSANPTGPLHVGHGRQGALGDALSALRDAVTALSRIRGENPVIGRGRRVSLSATQDTWVYRMTGCGEMAGDVVVAINRADGGNTVSIPAGSYDDLVSGTMATGGSVTLGPRSFRVLRVR